METDELQEMLIPAVISVVIALVATYAVSMFIPTDDLMWAMYAVGIASFLSSLGTSYSFISEE